MQFPDFLKPGDKVAIVATAKRLEDSIDEGIAQLKSWDLEILVDDHVYGQSGYFAGQDSERIKSLQFALDDPEVKAIIFARGGYGTTRILDHIVFDEFLKKPKWLVGFSDLTSLLLHVSALGIPSIHGPVALTIGKDKASDDYLKALLFGKLSFDYPLTSSAFTQEGSCTGKIVGGNLTLIHESIGAANEIETFGNILFLEEVGEAKYSVDRMLNKLKRTGKLDKLTGLIVGSFSSISDHQMYFKESIDEMLYRYFSPLKIPMVFGLSAGHEKLNYPLIVGAKATVTCSQQVLSIQYLDQETSN